jgi:hypothetical protein
MISGGPAVVNPDLTWEKIATLDLGADLRFWKDMFGLTVDWYEKKTTGAITDGDVVPSTYGGSAPRVNYGELTTKGIEIELNFNYRFNNGLKVNASAQFTDYKTVITKYASSADPIIPSSLFDADYYEGKTQGEFWGYKVERLFQKDDFEWIDDKTIKTVTIEGKTINKLKNLDEEYQWLLDSGTEFRFSPGDVMYKDLNYDDVITDGKNTVTNPGDRTVIGNRQPRYQYSFRLGAEWKGVDFDIFFQGVGKRNVYATGNMVLPGFMGSEANFAHTLDYWREDNPGAFYPRPMSHSSNGAGTRWNYLANDRYMLNLAYLRCKTLTVGYTLPKNLTQRAMINRMRIYFTGENLFEFDKMGGVPLDPEINFTVGGTANDARMYGRSYPYRRTVSFGLQVDF